MKKNLKIGYAETIEVRDTCLCMHIQRGARAIARRFDDAFRPLDLTHGQFSLLMSLNRPEAAILSSVADLLGMDRTSLTAKLKPLERRGLIKSYPDPIDRRNRRLALTEAGQHLIAEAYPLWKATHKEINKIVGSGNQNKLRETVRLLAHDM